MQLGPPKSDDPRASLKGYLAAVLLSAAVVVARQMLEPVLPGQAPFLVLSAAPLLAAWYGGAGPGLLALVVCSVAGQLLFGQADAVGLPANAEAWLRLGSFVLLGTLSVWLIASRRIALYRLQREHTALQTLLASQQQAEAALRLSQARLHQLFETNLLGIV